MFLVNFLSRNLYQPNPLFFKHCDVFTHRISLWGCYLHNCQPWLAWYRTLLLWLNKGCVFYIVFPVNVFNQIHITWLMDVIGMLCRTDRLHISSCRQYMLCYFESSTMKDYLKSLTVISAIVLYFILIPSTETPKEFRIPPPKAKTFYTTEELENVSWMFNSNCYACSNYLLFNTAVI